MRQVVTFMEVTEKPLLEVQSLDFDRIPAQASNSSMLPLFQPRMLQEGKFFYFKIRLIVRIVLNLI